MSVTVARMPIGELYRIPGHVRWRRWRSGVDGGASQEFATLGHLPDGRWWVEATHAHDITVFAGDHPLEVRAAARTHLGRLMRGRRWRRTIATFVPGVVPARAATVPDWPPGHGPG